MLELVKSIRSIHILFFRKLMFDLDTILSLLNTSFLNQPLSIWLGFFTLISIVMAFDLGFLSRSDKAMSPKVSLCYSAFYIFLAILFGVWLTDHMGTEHSIDYFTAYVIELSLSLDNLFVMSVLLAYFKIPKKYQHRVLFWGIIGVLLMRGLMIGSGIAIIQSFDWILYVFAAFLIFTGGKMLLHSNKEEEEGSIKDSVLIRFFQNNLRCTKTFDGHKFFVWIPQKQDGPSLLHVTPLFLALLCIEFMDVVFALDSIPAVFAISHEPFVVYSSNIFAIIGLRSMYFAVVALLDRFKYMNFALSLVLIFIGGKVFYSGYFGEINHFVSLAITISLLVGGALFSVFKTRKEQGV